MPVTELLVGLLQRLKPVLESLPLGVDSQLNPACNISRFHRIRMRLGSHNNSHGPWRTPLQASSLQFKTDLNAWEDRDIHSTLSPYHNTGKAAKALKCLAHGGYCFLRWGALLQSWPNLNSSVTNRLMLIKSFVQE